MGATPPKTIVIDNVPIFVQTLSAAQAAANGVEGWDAVLTDIKELHPDVAERHIAAFWASWKRKQMSREYLGKNIQLFSGHGWWKKHLKIANLSNDDKCWLCCEKGTIKYPIHLFTECAALADVRQELFNDSFPTQLMGRQSLCQVSELALCGSLWDLIERTDQNLSNICSTE